jgi:hypothetical protein
MYPKANFINHWVAKSPDTDEAQRIQRELETRLPGGAEVTLWFDMDAPRVDIDFDSTRILNPREIVHLGETLALSLGKGVLRIFGMTPSSVCFYVNRPDLAPTSLAAGRLEDLGTPFEDFANCWKRYLE